MCFSQESDIGICNKLIASHDTILRVQTRSIVCHMKCRAQSTRTRALALRASGYGVSWRAVRIRILQCQHQGLAPTRYPETFTPRSSCELLSQGLSGIKVRTGPQLCQYPSPALSPEASLIIECAVIVTSGCLQAYVNPERFRSEHGWCSTPNLSHTMNL